MSISPVYKSYDLNELSLLPSGWERDVGSVVCSFGSVIQTDGRSSTSREPEDSRPVDVCVVTGDVIAEHLPWLHRLYENELTQYASDFAGRQAYSAIRIESGVNINCLRGAGARYERHVDSNPVTGLLFVNTLDPNDGGQLVFEAPGEDIAITPKSGVFLIFDARQIIHYVSPLTSDIERISAPMNFYLSREEQQRPEDLDSYLYKP